MQHRRRGQGQANQSHAAQHAAPPGQGQSVSGRSVSVHPHQPYVNTPYPPQAYVQPTHTVQSPVRQSPFPQAQAPFRTAPQQAHAQIMPQAKLKRKTMQRLLWILLLVGNIAALVISLVFNGLTLASQRAKQAEYDRIVNNHPLYFRDDIEAAAERYNLQPSYVSAIIKNESSFRTDAQSNVGALGLMQLMPDTAEWIAGKLGDSNYAFERMADGKTNMEYGCWYLNFLSKRFWSDPILTTAAYHTGQGTIANWLSNKDISPDGRSIPLDKMPDGPTKQYVRRVLDSYAIYEALYFNQP